MLKRRDFLKKAAVAGAAGLAAPLIGAVRDAAAQEHRDVLLVAQEGGPNSLDTQVVGANKQAWEVNWNCYDRLVAFDVKKDANGNDYLDAKSLRPELAEEWDQGQASLTFRLRRDAKFHDGTPVTAKDVKFSFDRSLAVGGFPRFQLNSVSLTTAEQFVAVDDHTFRIDFQKRDNFTLAYVGTPVGLVYNSELVKKHATAADPFALQWTKQNVAGGGAYKVQSFTAGQEIVLVRNEEWALGKKPQMQRVIVRVVPSAGTRRALLERGDIDFSYDIPPKDVADLASNAAIKTVSSAMDNTAQYLSMNLKIAPFDNPKVRQAVAYAIPYDDIVRLAFFGRAGSLAGGSPQVAIPDWPQRIPFKTDLARAKSLMAEAGHADGFATTLSYDMSMAVTSEPLCTLVQNALAQIGIRVTLNKIPGANWRSEVISRKLPMLANIFGGWLPYPYFYFGWLYYDPQAQWNSMGYDNPRMRELIDTSHYDSDIAKATAAGRDCIDLALSDLPAVPILQPYLNSAMRKNIDGYAYCFFRQVDYRPFVKS